jgi:hypothetical protein
MKKVLNILNFAAVIFVILTFSSCTGKLTVKKAENIIKEHPFLKETSVAITDKYLPDCDRDLLGKKENGYIRLRDMATAYYYKKHGFKLVKIENLTVDRENNSVTCRAILAPEGITDALNELQKQSSYFEPDISIDGEPFTVTLLKDKKKGWTVADFRHSSESSFKINGWRNDRFIYDITPNSYNEKGEIPVKTYSY